MADLKIKVSATVNEAIVTNDLKLIIGLLMDIKLLLLAIGLSRPNDKIEVP